METHSAQFISMLHRIPGRSKFLANIIGQAAVYKLVSILIKLICKRIVIVFNSQCIPLRTRSPNDNRYFIFQLYQLFCYPQIGTLGAGSSVADVSECPPVQLNDLMSVDKFPHLPPLAVLCLEITIKTSGSGLSR